MNEFLHWVPSLLVFGALLWRGGQLQNRLDEIKERIERIEREGVPLKVAVLQEQVSVLQKQNNLSKN